MHIQEIHVVVTPELAKCGFSPDNPGVQTNFCVLVYNRQTNSV